MSDRATRPAALRLTDADRERLLAHGGTVRAAVLTLLDVADEHASCRAPRGTRRPPVPRPTVLPPTVSTQQQQTTTYVVTVAGEQVYSTTNKALAEKRERMERARRPADPVEMVTR